MKKAVVIMLGCVWLMSACGKTGSEPEQEAVHAQFDVADVPGDASEQEASLSEIQEVSDADADTSADTTINVIWRGGYGWAFGGDIVYIDSYGNLYEEHEVEQPDFEPLGACQETFTGTHFTKDELEEFLRIDPDDEDRQLEMLSKKGLWFGRLKE